MSGVKAVVRLLVPAAQAKPTPAIGQALGSLGINMMNFCKEFNAKTTIFKDNTPVRVKLYAKHDGTYHFDAILPPTTWFLKNAAGIKKGASNPGSEIVGEVNARQIYELSKLKKERDPSMMDMSLEGISKCIVATCKTMGLKVVA